MLQIGQMKSRYSSIPFNAEYDAVFYFGGHLALVKYIFSICFIAVFNENITAANESAS